MMGFYEKFKKYLKKGLKAWHRCNWPELSRYCGCCELSTGIYIRCAAMIVITTATIIFNCFLVISLLHARKRIRNADMTTLEEMLEEATDSENDLNGVFMILDGVVTYFILWCNFKLFYVIRNVWTIIAVYRKSRRSLKMLLYIGVPCWIFDGFMSIIAIILLTFLVKGMLFLNFMFEGYNLLAVHSKYKEISGKSRIVTDFGIPTEIDEPYVTNAETPVDTANQPHCITCQCFVRHEGNSCPHADDDVDNAAPTPVTGEPTIAEMWSDSATAEAVDSNDNKGEETKNFKDSPIIYNQEILQGANVLMATSTTTEEKNLENNIQGVHRDRPQRPTTLAIRPLGKEEKTDLCDTPVIYDERQFDVGISPIIESVNFCSTRF